MTKAYKNRELSILRAVHTGASALLATGFSLLTGATLVLVFSVQVPIGTLGLLLLGLAIVLPTEVILSSTLPGRRLGPGGRLRITLVLAILFYGLGSWVIDTDTTNRFSPNFINIGLPILLATAFSLMAGLHQPLLRREKLLGLFEGQKEADLLQLLQEEHPRILAAYNETRGVNSTATGIFFLVLVYHAGLWGGGLYPSTSESWYLVFTALTLLGVFVIWDLGNSYLDDHRNLRRTALYSLEQRIHRLFLGGLVLAIGLFLGWLLPRDQSLVPPALTTSFFAWLFSLFHNRSSSNVPELGQIFTAPPRPELPPILDEQSALQSYRWAQILEFVSEVLQRALLIGAIVGLVYFLIAPFLETKGWRQWLDDIQNRKTKNLLIRFLGKSILLFIQLRKILRNLFRSRQVQWTDPSNPGAQPILDHYLRYLDTTKKESQKRHRALSPLGALLQRYLTLVQHLGVELRPSMTLLDVTKATQTLLPEIKGQETLGLLGATIEQLLYDPLLPTHEIRRHLRQVQGLVTGLEKMV